MKKESPEISTIFPLVPLYLPGFVALAFKTQAIRIQTCFHPDSVTNKSKTDYTLINIGNSPRARRLNQQIVSSHHNSEPSLLPPILSPIIPPYPILHSTLRPSPSHHFHDMSSQILMILLYKHTSFISSKLVRNHHKARNRASFIDLRLHLLHSQNLSILRNAHFAIGRNLHALAEAFAVHASPTAIARLLFPLVHLTRLVRDRGHVRKAVHLARIAAIARP